MEALAEGRFCETCGSFASADMLSGFCPSCLLNTVLETEAESPPSGSRIEDYELLNEIARGGMGIVYRARQRTPSRIVALKMILPAHLSSPGALDRFRSEAEAAAALDHEGVLPIYAVGEHDGAPFYSMKFAEGGALSTRLKHYRDRPRDAATLIAKLSRAVEAAHGHGILHRDLKPANVLFDAADKPYVADFGLAKWVEREGDLTQTLGILGTPFYMAPEQAANSRGVTAAADIYSLGAILYHLLEGRPPVEGDTPMEVLHQARTQAVRLTSGRVPRDLATICLKCLEKDAAARYSSATALADDLERFCADRPIRARSVGLASRSFRWMHRNPVISGLIILSLVLAILVLARPGSSLAPAMVEPVPTNDAQAHELYLQARSLLYDFGSLRKTNAENAHKAVELLEAAVGRDPQFALAYCLLSEAQLRLYAEDEWRTDEFRAKARGAGETALRISPKLGQAHLAMARYYFEGIEDGAHAGEELKQALVLLPEQADVQLLASRIASTRGQWIETLRAAKRAAELSPRDPLTVLNLAATHLNLRRYADAEREANRGLTMVNPPGSGPFWRNKSVLAVARGDADAALAALDSHPSRRDGLAGLNLEVVKVLTLQRHYEEAGTLLASLETVARARNVLPQRGSNNYAAGSEALQAGIIARAQNKTEEAHAAFTSAAEKFGGWIAMYPDRELTARARSLRAVALAGAGRADEALRAAREAVALWPISRDATVAPKIARDFALSLEWCGQPDAALKQLHDIVNLPAGLTGGELRLDPVWDELRANPRFAQLVNEATKPISTDAIGGSP